MMIRKMNVINKITESGLVNDLVSSIEAVQDNKNTIVVFFKRERWNHDMVMFKGNSDCYLLINNRKEDTFNYDALTLPREKRFTWTYSGGQGSIASYKILAVLKDIIDNCGLTRETYIGLEANHKLPRIYKIVNSVNNLEICSQTENIRHFAAWRKLQSDDILLPIKFSANSLELVADILFIKTDIYRLSDKVVVRRPLEDGSIREYVCIPQEDGTWQFK